MITGYTRLAGVMASPIKHSVSPMIHNTAFQEKGIDAVYLAFDILPKQLEEGIAAIRTLDMLGVNLSMPLKKEACRYVDEVSKEGTLLGAINTIVNKDGKLIGYNTDGRGFMKSMEQEKIELYQKNMTVLGAGGAARAIIVQAALDGVKEIHVFNRTQAKLTELTELVANVMAQTGCMIKLYELSDQQTLISSIASSQLLVNCTSVGMGKSSDQSLIEKKWLHKNIAVADIVYEPRETKLLKEAKEVGAKTVNGLGMLLYQAAIAFELWTGVQMPVETVKQKMEG